MPTLRGFRSYRFSSRRGVSSCGPCRVVPRPVVSAREACRCPGFSSRPCRLVGAARRFYQLVFLCRFVRWGVRLIGRRRVFRLVGRLVMACSGAGRSVRRLVRRLVVRFGLSRLVGRLVGRLVSSSCSHRRSHCLIRHRSSDSGVPVSFRRGYRYGCLVLRRWASSLVSCSIHIRAVFPSSVYRHGVAWIVPVPVAAWRVHPHPPLRSRPSLIALRSQSVRVGFSLVGSSVGPSRLPGWVSRFPLSSRLLVSFAWRGFVSSYPYAPFLPVSISHLFPIAIVEGRRPNE